MIRRPPRSTHCISSAASDVYKRQEIAGTCVLGETKGGGTCSGTYQVSRSCIGLSPCPTACRRSELEEAPTAVSVRGLSLLEPTFCYGTYPDFVDCSEYGDESACGANSECTWTSAPCKSGLASCSVQDKTMCETLQLWGSVSGLRARTKMILPFWLSLIHI